MVYVGTMTWLPVVSTLGNMVCGLCGSVNLLPVVSILRNSGLWSMWDSDLAALGSYLFG